jgi:hypothetical protein
MPFYTQHDILTFFAGEASAILDPFSCKVAPEDVAFGDKDACYDINHIGFTQSGDMLYRGKFRYPKEVFSQFPKKVQAIYYNNFTDYRTNDQSSSGSSNHPTSLAPQNDPSEVHNLNEVHDPILIDNTDATGLLEVPISINDDIPLKRAYKQYEPQGFQTIADKLMSQTDYYGWDKTHPEAAALSRKRKQIGFSTEEVVMYGGLTCTPCRESDISDPLLATLFRQENFYNTTQEVYNVITPALKLAEKFITDPALIGYWSTLAFGAREVDEALTSRDGICRERIVQSVGVTDETYAQTIHLLNRMGKLVEYRFEPSPIFENGMCAAFAQNRYRRWNLAPEHHAMLSQGYLWPTGQPFPMARQYPKDPWEENHVVCLHPDFAIAARRFSATKNQDVAARLRFNFYFAVTIVHELAHLFEGRSSQVQFEQLLSACTSLEESKQLLDPRRHMGTSEALYGPNSTWAEAGGRWEWETFGGKVNPINLRLDASRGLMLLNADGWSNIVSGPTGDTAVGMCIKMAYIEEIQQQSFWRRKQRTLKFPLSGAMAYVESNMMIQDVDHYLIQRDQESAGVSDPEDAHQGPSKRRRLDPAGEVTPQATGAREIKKASRRGGLRQTIIRKYPSKAKADANATRREAMAAFAEKDARRKEAAKQGPHAQRMLRWREAEERRESSAQEMQRMREAEEERKREAEDEQKMQAEEERRREAEEERRREAEKQRKREAEEEFFNVPPGQTRLDDFLTYSGEDPQDAGLPDGYAELPYVDPATLCPYDLTFEDKWKLAEEWVCLSMKWEPIEFQDQRVTHPSWRPDPPFNPDDPDSFTQQALDSLKTCRANYPGQSWPERRAIEKKLYDQKKKEADTLAQMDELITYMGFSRIECHRILYERGEFPMGITVENFPAYKPLLDAFRLTRKIRTTREYVSAVQQGQVSADAAGVVLIKEDSKPDPEPPTTQTTKITDYYSKKPKEAKPTKVCSKCGHSDCPKFLRLTSMAPVSADPDGFAPLIKVPTPEELVRKYEAWVAGGSLLNKLPEDVHIAQALSARLGGSLRIKTPEELAKVVAERELKFEAEKKAKKNEKKRKEAKARADAAEERKRLERAKGRGSGSGDSKESDL